ncbi:DUF3955 domain-containing protein [Enterococcus faecalis]|uniref:DUF3955 domain-containing protein n=1 Tax=Enterococcus faecalis TaxID=1351 RepID=UPI003DA0267A
MKKYRISLFLGLISLLLFMISILVGSTLSSDGLLKEPAFFCTPLVKKKTLQQRAICKAKF